MLEDINLKCTSVHVERVMVEYDEYPHNFSHKSSLITYFDDFLSLFTDPRWQYSTNIIYAAILIYICAILVFLNDVAYLYFYVAFYRYIYIQESMLRNSARLILIYGSLLTPGGQCLHILILVWLFGYILSFSGNSLLALKIACQNITVVLASIFRTCLREAPSP